ncbi:DedA family protein [Microbacterium sp. H1-D42]|uniref:DedA family protein n=1 Tax=Microbacterium sp. H1-D42 TaxID=2925844 RepID=UPI001F53C05E|nr:DedA family protein [Microbacterium sp. H1-D42]UNK72309.1 DedA family protein [Microbacterium sp. H1-D42]
MDLINELILQAVASPWLYIVLFAVTVIDGFFPPVPSETVLVAAAAVLTMSNWPAVLLMCVIAAVAAALGDNIAFLIGRRVGTARFRWMRRPRVAATFAYARRTLDRSGAALILGARYVPVGRVAVNMAAGASGFSWRRFAPLSVLSGLCWSIFSVSVGLLAGSWAQEQPLLAAVIGIVIALLIGIVVDRAAALRRRILARRSAANADPDDELWADRAVPEPQDDTVRLAG